MEGVIIYLVTNITDSTLDPKSVTIADIDHRVGIDLAPGETIDLERFSTRNQILDSTHIKVHLQEGRITVDTLGTEPRERIYVDAVLDAGAINVGTVSISEPLEISALVNGVETALTATQEGSHIYLDTNPLLPSTPTIQNISVTSANSEFSYALPIDSKRFLVRVREGDTKVKLSFTSGGTSSDFITISPGVVFSEVDVDASMVTLYLNANNAPRVIEVLSWAL